MFRSPTLAHQRLGSKQGTPVVTIDSCGYPSVHRETPVSKPGQFLNRPRIRQRSSNQSPDAKAGRERDTDRSFNHQWFNESLTDDLEVLRWNDVFFTRTVKLPTALVPLCSSL